VTAKLGQLSLLNYLPTAQRPGGALARAGAADKTAAMSPIPRNARRRRHVGRRRFLRDRRAAQARGLRGDRRHAAALRFGRGAERKGACCAGQDIYDAKRVAEKLGIAHYVLDYEQRFRERVIADFAETYARGETPIPCVRCNERVKFADLMDTARELGAEALATGHYVRRVDGAERRRAAPRRRSSARPELFPVRHHARAAFDLRFPLGGMEKAEVRAIAAELGPGQCRKARQPGHLFRADGRYADIVEKLKPDAARPGEIVDEAGRRARPP
jgi:tRNA U34 2-thiouridine synthase MnmA/TrmU